MRNAPIDFSAYIKENSITTSRLIFFSILWQCLTFFIRNNLITKHEIVNLHKSDATQNLSISKLYSKDSIKNAIVTIFCKNKKDF